MLVVVPAEAFLLKRLKAMKPCCAIAAQLRALGRQFAVNDSTRPQKETHSVEANAPKVPSPY